MFLQRMHENKGVEFYMNASMVELQGDQGAVQRAVLKDGRILEVIYTFNIHTVHFKLVISLPPLIIILTP